MTMSVSLFAKEGSGVRYMANVESHGTSAWMSIRDANGSSASIDVFFDIDKLEAVKEAAAALNKAFEVDPFPAPPIDTSEIF